MQYTYKEITYTHYLYICNVENLVCDMSSLKCNLCFFSYTLLVNGDIALKFHREVSLYCCDS